MALEETAGFVADLIGDYELRYFRFSDADLRGSPFVLFRFTGAAGASDVLLQRIGVRVVVVDDPAQATRCVDTAAAMLRRYRETDTAASSNLVVRYEPMGAIQGPLYLENGRPYCQFDLSVYVQGA